MANKVNLADYNMEQLLQLSDTVADEIFRRHKEIKQRLDHLETVTRIARNGEEPPSVYEYEFEFYAEGRSNEKPYAARLKLGKDSKFERDFINMHKTVNGRECIVSGKITANELDILEVRRSRNKEYYIVIGGEMQELCADYDTKEVHAIKTYLAGDIDVETMLSLVHKTLPEVTVPDELKD